MQNKNLDLFAKGIYEKVNNEFMVEGHEALQSVEEVQIKYKKGDTDTFINELRDSIVGYTLGFDLVNTEKHGFDCKRQESESDYFLEVKNASFVAKAWNSTFNDTTLEKTEAFKDKKLFLALAVWKNASDLLFVCFGQNKNLGDYLEEKVKYFQAGNTVRSTQTLSISSLVNNYGFKILVGPNKTKEEVLSILKLKSATFKKLTLSDIIDDADFTDIRDY